MKLLNVELIPNGGNVRASVMIGTASGGSVAGKIVKQPGARAYLETPPGLAITHKQKRQIQRAAVTRWADMIGDTLAGLMESEKVFRGSRFGRLGVQMKVFCSVCGRNTPSEYSKTKKGMNRNACYFCGTLRKGKPFIGAEEMERIQDKLNACQGTGVSDARVSV